MNDRPFGQLVNRLEELRAEFAAGEKMLAEIEEKRARPRESLLRIAGAIQVLEELSQGGEASGSKDEG